MQKHLVLYQMSIIKQHIVIKLRKLCFYHVLVILLTGMKKIAALQDSGGRSKSDCILHREVEHF